MSETSTETADGFDGWGDAGSQPDDATDVEPGTGDDGIVDAETEDEVVDGEIEPDPEPEGDELAGDARWVDPDWTSTAVEPYRVGDDHTQGNWGGQAPTPATKPSPRQGPNDGARPGGGSGGGGGGAGSGGKNSWRPRKPKKIVGGGSGGGGAGVEVNVLRIGGGNRRTVNASLVDTRGSGSNNKAGVIEARKSPRRSGGASRIAGRKR